MQSFSDRFRDYLKSNVLGLVAIFIALSGTAVAVRGEGTVGSRQIKDNAVRSIDVRDESLNGGDVDDQGLNGADIDDDTLTGAQILESTLSRVPNADKLDDLDSSAFGYGVTTARLDPDETQTTYVPGIGSSFEISSPNRSDMEVRGPTGGFVARDFVVWIGPGADDWEITLMANGQPTALRCRVEFGDSLTCGHLGGVSIPDSALLAFRIEPPGGAGAKDEMHIVYRLGPA